VNGQVKQRLVVLALELPPMTVTRPDIPVVSDPLQKTVPNPQLHPHSHRKPVDSRVRYLRRWWLALAVCVAIPVALAAVMIAQHGPAFFVFRSGGTGQSPESALSENQGPGQPDAPRAAVAAKPPVKPQPKSPVLVARSPNTWLAVPAGSKWAGIAELKNGTWAVLDAGASEARVAAGASRNWRADPGRYLSQWVIVPVRS
jgi:hypothetical protein